MPSPQNGSADTACRNTSPKPRRFAPEPVETSVKSSKSARKHSPEKGPSKVRRFAPEPIETTTKSSRSNQQNQNENSGPRRFAPQPIETSQKSSKDKSLEKTESSRIRFKPQLVETSYAGNRKSRQDSDASDSTLVKPSEERAPRKFIPVVLSTARRSRKAGDSNVAKYRDYRTEEGHLIHVRELQKHAGFEGSGQGRESWSAGDDGHHAPYQAHELPSGASRRPISPHDGSPGPRPAVLKPSRNHSFRCPALDTIESSESEGDSGPSSRFGSPGPGSPITTDGSSFNEFYKHATRIRESVDENFSQYLLKLEAQKAEQRMREQALAAFPNSDFHEPVQHYVNDDQDSLEDEIEDRPVTWEGFEEEENRVRVRRQSTGTPWEQMEMQRHAENLEQERKANRITATKQEPPSPWWNPITDLATENAETEIRSMRDRARPPMLGRDLVFPRCPSPDPARFDVTQGSDKIREQMSPSRQQSQGASAEGFGLWSSAPKTTQKGQSTSSSTSRANPQSSAAKGLWGGFCVGKTEDKDTLAPPLGPTGLMTPLPRTAEANPFDQSIAVAGGIGAITTPPTPPDGSRATDLANLDAVLSTEREFEEAFSREYPDAFVTQVFNYLSLGYPSLARPFDEELSKISRIPVPELRQDDQKAKQNPRGYIRLDPDFEGEGLQSDGCARWQGLKMYIREWARQEKNMVQIDAPGGNWATTNRRGSWRA